MTYLALKHKYICYLMLFKILNSYSYSSHQENMIFKNRGVGLWQQE